MEQKHTKKRTSLYILLGSLFALVVIIVLALGLKTQWTIDQVSATASKEHEYQLYEAFSEGKEAFSYLSLPQKVEGRKNFLLAGMRGFGQDFGPLLTDTIILVSIEEKSGEVALVSIPRDLLVQIPYSDKVKINELYAIGYEKGGDELAFNVMKTVVSQVAGVHIDGMVRVNFEGFEKLIDIVGGIDVHLDKPFKEIAQWEGIGGFSLPAGDNHLNGEEALYFVRSRFSTSDFDRARRQQLVLVAFKKKLGSLGVLANPIKVYAILDTVGSNVKTDIPMSTGEGIALVNHIKDSDIKHLILSTDNYLRQETTPLYVLLPQAGNYTQIHQAIQQIFEPEEHSASSS